MLIANRHGKRHYRDLDVDGRYIILKQIVKIDCGSVY
jgi:hypothetical protein